jgi:predicted acyl esterase
MLLAKGWPSFGKPGKIVQYEIDMRSTSHVFLAGHQIRLEVSSSAFP